MDIGFNKGIAVIEPKHNEPSTAKELHWRSAGLTHVGKIRRHNEDSFLERSDIGLWAVADGMGGHSAGDVASQMIVDSLNQVTDEDSLPQRISQIEDQLLQVNQHLIEKATEGGQRLTIGSTVVALLTYRDLGVFIWAGDSRIYRHREDQLQQLSADHSQVELYVEQGLISREEASHHPHANMITRAVGAADELFLDMDMCNLRSGDRFLLCSDGLTKHVTDLEIRDLLADGDTGAAANNLVDLSLTRKAADNITVVVVDIF
ncbi:serine/threonine protein phosphatase PrpC [Methylohalomonas lacus]|uniref:Serine/threonine protein phosphatase PrpC n=1 Tax=Methylohalomonas lacus TaxID=398773 RepID=A0AAE3HJM0_9GAMM|nr:protein phosphatase 2C domain-containing protein [Methylohalomonas lacus]MCS3902433.1 serine/threonine protein phosphatase PrpC [Methylohalomonas lacus]